MDNKNEELTAIEISTIRWFQHGKSMDAILNPIPDLVEKGYFRIDPPGIAKLTEKGLNYK